MTSPQSLARAPEGRMRGAMALVARSMGAGRTGTSLGWCGDRHLGAVLCSLPVLRPQRAGQGGPHRQLARGSSIPGAEEWGVSGHVPWGWLQPLQGATHTPVTSVHRPTHTHSAPGFVTQLVTRRHIQPWDRPRAPLAPSLTPPAAPAAPHRALAATATGQSPARHWLPRQ